MTPEKVCHALFLAAVAFCSAVLLTVSCAGLALDTFFQACIPPCIFRETLGVYCPGCGGVRSFLFLIEGDILSSLWYHPFVLYGAFLLALFVIFSALSLVTGNNIPMPKIRFIYFAVGIILILFQWILKNVLLLCFSVQLIPF